MEKIQKNIVNSFKSVKKDMLILQESILQLRDSQAEILKILEEFTKKTSKKKTKKKAVTKRKVAKKK